MMIELGFPYNNKIKLRKLSISVLVAGMFFIASPVWAEPVAQSGPQQVPLIEVFTSEGCSSCVPAWTWLNNLKNEPGLWHDFIPVSFHVDYWDYLGWKDHLSQKNFSDRQYAYAADWKEGTVYTPGFVLNGKKWRSWNKQEPFKDLKKEMAGSLAIETLGDDSYKITFHPSENNDAEKAYQAHVTLLAFDYFSDIKVGENRGRQLAHDFAVVAYNENQLKEESNGQFISQVNVKFPDTHSSRKGIAVWVTTQKSMTPIQATGGFIN